MDTTSCEPGLQPIWRCERCSWWEPRYERAVNAIPNCPHCRDRDGRHRRTKPVRLWQAVRRKEIEHE